ncbi:hypothetical protein [uncultured Limosilactobacillus sp.]|uniref:hypothetical protein n=1 Tax=uncultured Limosilactobacillus sp. TaxID=2837629 RepID=UPI0025D86124|nr:hypothetical protein [uncultured Limosilactobacillus sp.]
MLNTQTKFVTLTNGTNIWTRRVGNGPRKLMLVHRSDVMPWNYLQAFTDLAQQNDWEIIFVELSGAYLSDQTDSSSLPRLSAQVEEIQRVVAAYHLDHFMIHGIGDVTAVTRSYVDSHPTAHRLITVPDESAQVRATEILGNFTNTTYQNLIRNQMRRLVSTT